MITKLEGNVIMSEGLVLQDVDVWYDSTKIPTTPHNNMTELYFEDNDIEGIIEKLESGKYVVSYVTDLMERECGQKDVYKRQSPPSATCGRSTRWPPAASAP